jgi:small subunit ribosomal protein S19
MPRSVWKGPFVDGYLLSKAEKAQSGGRREAIKTWSRRSTIMPQFVGLTLQLHNCKTFTPVLVS